MTLSDKDWQRLIDKIRRREVIPLIGPGVVTTPVDGVERLFVDRPDRRRQDLARLRARPARLSARVPSALPARTTAQPDRCEGYQHKPRTSQLPSVAYTLQLPTATDPNKAKAMTVAPTNGLCRAIHPNQSAVAELYLYGCRVSAVDLPVGSEHSRLR